MRRPPKTMTNVWDAEQASANPVVRINGQSVEVEADQPFAQTIKQLAAAKGLSRFTVRADGTEIKTHNVPATFSGLKMIEVAKYDEAAF